MVKDPICGMDVNPITAKFVLKKDGKSFYFCSVKCKDDFEKKTTKVTFPIEGMSCASCVFKIESGLKSVGGVRVASVNLATQSASVEYDPQVVSELELKDAIKKTGYSVAQVQADGSHHEHEDHAIAYWKKRIIVAGVFGIPLLYVAMGKMLGLPLPGMSEKAIAILEFVLATPIIGAGFKFYKKGLIALFKRVPNMESLVALGTGTAYLFSIWNAIGILKGKPGELYFEIAGLVVAFVMIGKLLEALAKGKSSMAMKKLLGLQAKTARVLRGGVEQVIAIENVQVGDLLIIKPGEKIAVDGVVKEGNSSVDESMISGESIPVEKIQGSIVIGGTINKNGALVVRATKIGKDTVLAQIMKFVQDAQGSKAPVQEFVDKVAYYFVPSVMVVAIISLVTWWMLGFGSVGFTTFIAVLVIACPCALGLATPSAIIAGTGRAAQFGILFKQAETFQRLRELQVIVFDKTGTLTKGKPQVTDIVVFGKAKEGAVLQIAAMVEKKSEHPLADAIMAEAEKQGIKVPNASEFLAISGMGAVAKYAGKTMYLGNQLLMEKQHISLDKVRAQASVLESQGKTVVFVASMRQVLGMIAVRDEVKPFVKEAIDALHKAKIKVVLMTGDNEKTARAIAAQVGIDDVFAGVLPGQKAQKIKELQEKGLKVGMVGDGINDAPALTQADVGFAIGSGTDIAIESGNVILMKSDVRDVIVAMAISKKTVQKIKQNLFWAFAYNVVLIPVAAGVLYPLGFVLNPAIAGLAMALSSVSVVSNSLLLQRYSPKLANVPKP